MITILSDNGQFRADLIETDEGVYTIFSKKLARADAEIWEPNALRNDRGAFPPRLRPGA